MSELPKISELLKQPEKMRVMCAEALGILYYHETERMWAVKRSGFFTSQSHAAGRLQKYDTSLDAMAEAEATLTDEEHYLFRKELAKQCVNDELGQAGVRKYHRDLQSRTALQRLAAFLIAKGLARP